MSKRKAPNGTAKNALQRVAFMADDETLANLEKLASQAQQESKDAGNITHGIDQGRSRAIRQAINYTVLHRKVL